MAKLEYDTVTTPQPVQGTAPAKSAVDRWWRWALAVFVVAMAVMEMYMHRIMAIPTGFGGFLLPELSLLLAIGPREPGKIPPRAVLVYNVLHRPILPLAGLVWLTFNDMTNHEAGPYISFFLAWLGTIATARALGFGLRAKDGSNRQS